MRVTEVLHILNIYDGISQSRLDKAADRGREIHKVCLGWLAGYPYPCPAEYRQYFDTFKGWADSVLGEVLAVEKPFEDAAMHLSTKGIDLIAKCKTGKDFFVFDLKTYSAWGGNAVKAVGMQLAAYQYLAEKNLKQKFPRRFAIHLQEDKVHLHEFKDRNDWTAFQAAWSLYNFLNK